MNKYNSLSTIHKIITAKWSSLSLSTLILPNGVALDFALVTSMKNYACPQTKTIFPFFLLIRFSQALILHINALLFLREVFLDHFIPYLVRYFSTPVTLHPNFSLKWKRMPWIHFL